jgi:formamidopyrimidine-DNA glycosylase
MPELPEVETVARGLRAVLPGRRILSVRLGETDFIEDPAAVERLLPGLRVSSVRRHGKFLVVDFDPSNGDAQDLALMIHLGMTGQIVTCPPEARVAPHTHVFLALDDGRELRYTDIRRFGHIRLLAGSTRASVLGKVGLDPLEATEVEFRAKFRGRRSRIKALLLDQHVLGGMGNIYTDESLWRARIHPMRLGGNLRDPELRKLYRAVRGVLTEAIRLRGSSISDYVDSDGRRGEFQLRHRVYQRKGKKCFRCETPIRRAIVAGRSSYFCPRCQLAPRVRAKKARPNQRQRPIRKAPMSMKIPA